MAELNIPKQAPNIGQCIYCGISNGKLEREHAIPFGLNGPWVLRNASCRSCANITKKFEQETLRHLYLPIRSMLNMKTRNPENRPTKFDLVIESNGIKNIIQVPANEFPLYLPIPKFSAPRCLSSSTQIATLDCEIKFIRLSGDTFEQVALKHAAQFAGAKLNFSPYEFARTLAKIAYTIAVYVLGISPFSKSPIKNIILGKDQSVFDWVGSWEGEPMNEAKGLHGAKVCAIGSEIHVILRLFAQFGTPEYHIVLGEADPQFVNSENWPWK